MIRTGILAIAVAASWFAAAAPSVARADGGSILIYGPREAGADQLQAARERLSQATGERAPDAAIHVLDLPFPSPDPIWIAGDARVVPCSDPAYEDEDLAGRLAAAVEQIDGLDYEAGKRTLDEAITALPCATRPVDRSVLLDLYYFRGIATFHQGDHDGARQNFGYALAIDKDKTWDTNYPPEPQQVFLLAMQDAIGVDRVAVGYDAHDAPISGFAIDGHELDPDTPGALQLLPGMHLMQYTADETAYSRLVEIRPGGPAALVTRAGLTDAVLAGPDDSPALPAARASLRALVQGRNLQRAYVVANAEDDGAIYVYDETYTTLTTSVADAGTGAGGAPGGGGGAAADPPSFAETGGGLTLGLAGFGYVYNKKTFGLSLRGHLRLKAGLELDWGAGAQIARWNTPDGGWLTETVPFVRLGARYRFGQRRARPYVGGVFLGSIGRRGGKTKLFPGGALIGGVDVHVARAVVLNAELTAGYSYMAWVGLQVGLGFRF